MSSSKHGADDVSIAEIMSRDVMCVRPEMPLAALAEHMVGGDLSAAPVVVDGGRAVGVVTISDLARAAWDPSSAARATTVGDVMMPFAFALGESATIARAAALMAYEGINRVIVTGTGGAVTGVVTAVDVMRWVARGEGYVVPGYTQVDASARVADSANRVLVIDDDSDIRDELADLLREEGYVVETASNGREALRALRRGDRPALILLDLKMPVMDGWSFRAELRKDPALERIPVVLLSGQGDAREEAVRLDARACLVKPVPYPTLLGTVEKYCAA